MASKRVPELTVVGPHKWQFAPRFRRQAFGWRSDTPIQRIKEAVSEIKLVARKDPALAAGGAVTFFEKLPPAIEQVDSSSGSMGAAVHRAIDNLVPIIARAEVERRVRQRWLERLWEAVQNDGMTYIENLGEHWGALCASPQMASTWADQFLPLVRLVWSPNDSGHGYCKESTPCLAALLAAGRHDELLALLTTARHNWWQDRRWGVKALVAMDRKAEALRYAEETRGINDPAWQKAEVCEDILLSSGLLDEAYNRYALLANQTTTNLATFRAIARKYPHKAAQDILRDLIASQPGSEGKWFAAAKDAGEFALALELANRSPTDPRTLARAARDFGVQQPDFAVACGLAALRWISMGYGYEITGADVSDAYSALMQAARAAGIDEQRVKDQARGMLAGTPAGGEFLKTTLGRSMST